MKFLFTKEVILSLVNSPWHDTGSLLISYGVFRWSLVCTPFFCLLMCLPFLFSHFQPPIFLSSFISLLSLKAYLCIFSVNSLCFIRTISLRYTMYFEQFICHVLPFLIPLPFTSHIIFTFLVIYNWCVCPAIISMGLSRLSSCITE